MDRNEPDEFNHYKIRFILDIKHYNKPRDNGHRTCDAQLFQVSNSIAFARNSRNYEVSGVSSCARKSAEQSNRMEEIMAKQAAKIN